MLELYQAIALGIALFIIWALFFWCVKKILFRLIGKRSHFGNLFLASADLPLNILILTSGIAFVDRIIGNAILPAYLIMGMKAVTVIAIVLFVDRFLTAMLLAYSERVDVLKTTGGIIRGVIRFVVLILGLLILLDTFGISITPLIASLGIGSLAVALALQPTLENFFAGVQIVIDKPFMVGQFIKLDSGEEGYVHKIGWRSVWVRLLANNVVIIPNKVMLNTKLLNYYYPVTEMSTLVQVGVHYSSDLEQVERVTIEVARETLQEVVGGTKTFSPFIRFHTFDAYSINFTVILRVNEFVDNYHIKHEFIKRLHRRYAQEGIIIPYPIRAVNYDQEETRHSEGKEKRIF